MSSGPLTSQSTVERPPQSSSRGKQPSRPRKRYHGTALSGSSFLTVDRTRPQTTDASSSESTFRPPLKPPGLSLPAEKASDTEERPVDEGDSDAELCFICGNSMKDRYYSLAPCNNAFCHNCSLRLRALYKSTNCPFCKVHCLTSIFFKLY
jgi:E3 ubiquitin-protein ligase ZNF598